MINSLDMKGCGASEMEKDAHDQTGAELEMLFWA